MVNTKTPVETYVIILNFLAVCFCLFFHYFFLYDILLWLNLRSEFYWFFNLKYKSKKRAKIHGSFTLCFMNKIYCIHTNIWNFSQQTIFRYIIFKLKIFKLIPFDKINFKNLSKYADEHALKNVWLKTLIREPMFTMNNIATIITKRTPTILIKVNLLRYSIYLLNTIFKLCYRLLCFCSISG